MKGSRRTYLVQTAFLTLVMGGVLGCVFASCLTDRYFAVYPMIAVYYYVIGMLTTAMIERGDRASSGRPQRQVQAFLAVHVVRLLVSVIVMVACCLLMSKEGAIAFLCAFMLNYIVYMVYDSCYFAHQAKKQVSENKKV